MSFFSFFLLPLFFIFPRPASSFFSLFFPSVWILGLHAYINFQHIKDSRRARNILHGKHFGERMLTLEFSIGKPTKVLQSIFFCITFFYFHSLLIALYYKFIFNTSSNSNYISPLFLILIFILIICSILMFAIWYVIFISINFLCIINNISYLIPSI